jgi:hypothetical protein
LSQGYLGPISSIPSTTLLQSLPSPPTKSRPLERDGRGCTISLSDPPRLGSEPFLSNLDTYSSEPAECWRYEGHRGDKAACRFADRSPN